MSEVFSYLKKMVKAAFTGEIIVNFHKGKITKVYRRSLVDLTTK